MAHSFPVAITQQPVTINQDIKAIPPSPAIAPRFLAYALKSRQKLILNECSKSGTTVASIETERLKELPLPLAPLSEQKRIADKLDSVLARVDACRDRLDRIPALLKRFRQSVLAAAISGRLTADWVGSDSSGPAQDCDAAGFDFDAGVAVQEFPSLPAGWQKAGQLTPALLAKAFRGELVPQNPANEPAAELLKRLAARRAEAPKARRGRKPVAAGR